MKKDRWSDASRNEGNSLNSHCTNAQVAAQMAEDNRRWLAISGGECCGQVSTYML
jgi:hypothetical protein